MDEAAFEAALTPDPPPPVVVEEKAESAFNEEPEVEQPPTEEKPGQPRDESGKFTKVEEPPAEDAKPDKAAKPRHDPQARIDELTRLRREAERRAEDAERRAAERERELEAARRAKQEPAASPKPETFPDYATYLQTHADASLEQWLDARDEWRDERREAQAREKREQESLEQTFSTKASAFGGKYAEALKADPTLEDRIDRNLLSVRPYSLLTAADKQALRNIADPKARDEVAFRCFLADHWIDSQHATQLLEHLSDSKEFQRLMTLPPAHVVRELVRLEAGFTAASPKERGSAPEAIPASQARPPIKPLGTAPRVPDDEGSDDEPVEAFIRRENARDRKAGRL